MGQIFKAPKLTGRGGQALGAVPPGPGGMPVDTYDGYAVTPSDGTDLPNGITRGLYCTGAGNIAVQLVRQDASGAVTILSTVTLAVAAGEVLPIAVSRVLATGTTATGISALY